jgi:hypothetical protein
VSVLAITQGWPIPVSLEGANDTLQILQGLILPWAREHGTRRQATITLAINLVARSRPDLPERDRVGYVVRLLPSLEILLARPLEVLGVLKM